MLQYSSEEEEVDLQTALTGYQTKQRKLLEPVDHGKIEYEPFRKNFYVEVPELAKMSQEGKICLFIYRLLWGQGEIRFTLPGRQVDRPAS